MSAAADRAPLSSRSVRTALLKAGVPEDIAYETTIITEVTPKRRALTTIYRKQFVDQRTQRQMDEAFGAAMKSLPGFAGSYALSMGRTFDVEWDGVLAPI